MSLHNVSAEVSNSGFLVKVSASMFSLGSFAEFRVVSEVMSALLAGCFIKVFFGLATPCFQRPGGSWLPPGTLVSRDRLDHRPGFGRYPRGSSMDQLRRFSLAPPGSPSSLLFLCSCFCFSLLPRPVERLATDQHPVHDHRQHFRVVGIDLVESKLNTPCA